MSLRCTCRDYNDRCAAKSWRGKSAPGWGEGGGRDGAGGAAGRPAAARPAAAKTAAHISNFFIQRNLWLPSLYAVKSVPSQRCSEATVL